MTRSALPLGALLAVLLTLVGARTAEACKCGEPQGVAFVTSPYVDAELGLELRSPSATLRCEGRRKAPRCHYEARYQVHNPSAQPLRASAVVLGRDCARPDVWLDGTSASPREPDALDERASDHAAEAMGAGNGQPLQRNGFVIDVPAQGSVELRVATVVTPTDVTCGCGELQIERWHLLVSRELERDYAVEHLRGFGFETDQTSASPNPYAGADELQLEQITDVPLRWSMSGLDAPHPRRIRGGHWAGRTRGAGYQGRHIFGFGARPPVLWGGPFAAVGVGWRDGAGLVLRGGWEVSRPAWLVSSLAVESDARSYVAVVPALEGTFPYWSRPLLLFPAPAVGVGMPIEAWPDPRFAVRAQLRLGWHILSILGVVDVYPAQAGDARDVRGALLFQVGV
jgi:hypothetical protein